MRRVFLPVLLALLAWLTMACSTGQTVPDDAWLGRALPVQAQDLLTGAAVDVGALRGRVVLIELWASWCETCKAAMPHHAALWNRWHDQGFDVIAVSLDEDRGHAERFLGDVAVPFAVAWDAGQHTANALQPRQMPTAYLLDREGRVLMVASGGTAEALATVDRAVKAAMVARVGSR